MAPRITNNTGINQFTNVPTEMQTYIPAMYQNGADCYESKGKKTSRIIKSVTSIFNSVLLTAGLAIGGFFGFKWLKGSNLSFMSKPLQKYDFKDVANLKSEDIKGNEKQKEELKNVIDYCIKHKNKDGIPKGCGVLLQGPPRCGKTMSAKVFAKESGLTTFSCKSDDIISSVRGQTEKNVDKLFEQLRKRVKKDGKPVILIMDEIDSFLMKRDNATNEERAMVNAFLRNCDELEKQGIIILGSTNYSDKCDKAAVGSGRFNHTIQFDLPKKKDLEEMLRKGKKMLSSGEDDISKIASLMAEHHMNWADAQNVLNKYTTSNGNIDYKDAMLYLIEKCQGNSTVQISSLIQKDPPGTKTLGWNDIYGLDDEKKILSDWVNDPKKSSGYLLSGEPGCGKTTLPYALAQKIGSDVYTLRIGENGVTVDNLKSVIEDIKLEGLKRKVKGEAPIILFLDEAETMFGNRKGADLMHSISNSYEKTGTAIDAIQNLQGSGILCIAATNAPECVDAAMKRAGGRLNEMKIGMPTIKAVEKFIRNKYETLKDKANEIASIFGNKNSKLSFANIKGILDEFVKTYNSDTDYEKWKAKLKNSVNEKEKSMKAKPLESSMTQISKSLDNIRKEIEKISENKEDIETKFKELKGHFEKLDGLDNLGVIAQELANLRMLIGNPKLDGKGQPTETILQSITELCNKLQGLENIKNIGKIENVIKSIDDLAASNNTLAQQLVHVVSGVGETMAHIKSIAESNTDLMDKYQELAGSVAKSMNEVRNVLTANTSAIGNLGTAIGSLNNAQEKLKELLERIKNENKENKGDDKTRDSIEYSLISLSESLSTMARTVNVLGYKSVKETLYKNLNHIKGHRLVDICEGSFASVNKCEKKYSCIDAFCFPLNDVSNYEDSRTFSKNVNPYKSFLTQMVDAFDEIIIHSQKSQKKYAINDLTEDEKKKGIIDYNNKDHDINSIQQKIDRNEKIGQLNGLLKNGNFSKDGEGFENSMVCFITLFNYFNWESLMSDTDKIFVNTNNKIVQNNTYNQPYIHYSDGHVTITEVTIPIIKDAFREIFDIVFDAWCKDSIPELRSSTY